MNFLKNFFAERNGDNNTVIQVKRKFESHALTLISEGIVKAAVWSNNGAGVTEIFALFFIQRMVLDLIEYDDKQIGDVDFLYRNTQHMRIARLTLDEQGNQLSQKAKEDLT